MPFEPSALFDNDLLPANLLHDDGIQSWYRAADAAGIGIDLDAKPDYAEILAVRTDRMAVVRRFMAGLTGDDLVRRCHRSPAPG